MNGTQIGQLMTKFDSGEILSDEELKILTEGVQFLADFHTEYRMPLAGFLWNDLGTLKNYATSRKEKP